MPIKTSEPKVGDVMWRAVAETRAERMKAFLDGRIPTSFVANTSLVALYRTVRAQIQFEQWLVVRVTESTYVIARSFLGKYEALPGCGTLEQPEELTEAEVLHRIKFRKWATYRQHKCAYVLHAWATKEQALESLRIRTTLRVAHAKNRLQEAETVLAEVQELIAKDPAEIEIIEV